MPLTLINNKLRFWSGYENSFRIGTMDWIVRKGSTVEEDKPTRFNYLTTRLVSDGRPDYLRATVYVCSDAENNGAPLYCGCKWLESHYQRRVSY